MKLRLISFAAVLCVASLGNDVRAQAFPNDNDGLLDVGEAPGFPNDPAAATGELRLSERGIEDLDGASLLTNLQSLNLDYNAITSIESGDFDGLTNLQDLRLDLNSIASIESGDFSGLTNLHTLGFGGNNIASIEPGDFDGLANLKTLYFFNNKITSIESGDFDGITNLQLLDLARNSITSVESGDFDGLANLQTLDLRFNGITGIESGAFAGLTELRTLTLFGNALTELNFSQATFDNLLPRPGFSIDSEEITSLLLDGAALSQGSFDVILDQTTSTVDVSLVNLTFTDGNPSDLSALLSIATLDNVRIDPTLYSLYAAELDEFDAIIGNTVTVVPEPLSIVLLILSSVAWQQRRRVDW